MNSRNIKAKFTCGTFFSPLCICGVPALITWLHANTSIGAFFPRRLTAQLQTLFFPTASLQLAPYLIYYMQFHPYSEDKKICLLMSFSLRLVTIKSKRFTGTDEFYLQNIPLGVYCPLHRQWAETENLEPKVFTDLDAWPETARICFFLEYLTFQQFLHAGSKPQYHSTSLTHSHL